MIGIIYNEILIFKNTKLQIYKSCELSRFYYEIRKIWYSSIIDEKCTFIKVLKYRGFVYIVKVLMVVNEYEVSIRMRGVMVVLAISIII